MDIKPRIALTLCLLTAQLAFNYLPVGSAAPVRLTVFPVPEEGAGVYDENGNGAPDLTGDTWVFDRNNDGRADLIVRFRQAGALTAEIYDDADANRQVDYRVGEYDIQILEPHWRVQITARDGVWVLPDGAPNWNLDLQADSGFRIRSLSPIVTGAACQMAKDSAAIGLEDQSDNAMYGPAALDGQPDFQIRYWDQNKDGVPDYEWRNFNWGGWHDVLLANTNTDLRYAATRRFPPLETLLGTHPDSARLTYINTLIPARANENGYFLLFNRPTHPEGVNTAFENPFAFYDLHNDHNCNSELKIRAVTEFADRLHTDLVSYSEIRYSWAQDSGVMQYRLYLIGQVYTNTVQQYPVYAVAHVGYYDLPGFALGHAWRGAAFAAAEPGMKDAGFTEGIYENLFYTPTLRAMLLSNRKQALPARYLPLYLNLREEYNLTTFQQKPTLYFSPIDRRLHLLNAQEGTVIFSADTADPAPGVDFSQQALASGELSIFAETRYADSDGDGHIDTWTYRENDETVRQLVVRPGVALLAEKDLLQVKKLPAEIGVAAWQAKPPANTAEWAALAAQLAPAQAGQRPLNDLTGMFADLPGDGISFPDTTLKSVSTQRHALFAGISTRGVAAAALQSTGGLAAGEYVLRAQNGAFSVEGPSPALLELSPLKVMAPAQAVDGLVGLLTFSVKNPGNADITAHINVWDALSRRVALLDEDKVIPAAGQVDFSLPWSPALPGAHQLIVQADYGDAPLSQQLDWQVDFPDPTPDAIFLSQPYLGVALTIMALLIGFILVGAWMVLKELGVLDAGQDAPKA